MGFYFEILSNEFIDKAPTEPRVGFCQNYCKADDLTYVILPLFWGLQPWKTSQMLLHVQDL